MKIVVLVSGGGTNLQAIIDKMEAGKIRGGEISAVISSNPEAYALERARKHNIPDIVVNRKSYKTKEEYSSALLSEINKIAPDLIVLAGFMCIISGEIIERYKNRIMNVHPALIPSFCGDGFYGLKVHEKALEYGVRLTGATVHFVSEVCDGGPIILQKAVEIKEDDTPEILQERVMKEAEWEILPKAIDLFCNGKIEVFGRKVLIKE